MDKLNSCNEQLDLSALITRMSESLTDIQWNVLKKQLICDETVVECRRGAGDRNP